jgi:hypothetical protein
MSCAQDNDAKPQHHSASQYAVAQASKAACSRMQTTNQCPRTAAALQSKCHYQSIKGLGQHKLHAVYPTCIAMHNSAAPHVAGISIRNTSLHNQGQAPVLVNVPPPRNSLELAMEISLTSLGSSHTLRRPQLRTLAASRFCSLSDTIPPAQPCARHAEHELTEGSWKRTKHASILLLLGAIA